MEAKLAGANKRINLAANNVTPFVVEKAVPFFPTGYDGRHNLTNPWLGPKQ